MFLTRWIGRQGSKQSKTQIHRRRQGLEMEFDLLATFQRRSKYDKRVDNHCFRCHRLNEDFNDVIRCLSAELHRQSLWKNIGDSVQGSGILPVCSTKISRRNETVVE